MKSRIINQTNGLGQPKFARGKSYISETGASLVVLCTENSEIKLHGTVIHTENTLYKYGTYFTNWYPSNFVPFHGTIELTEE